MDNIKQVEAIINVKKFIEVLQDDDSAIVDKDFVVRSLKKALGVNEKPKSDDKISVSTNATLTFYIGEIHATYDDIVKVFGQPHHEGSGDGKVQVEWCFEFEDTDDVFTIYDWKEYETKPKDVTEWHIGGYSEKTMNQVEKYFNEKLSLLS